MTATLSILRPAAEKDAESFDRLLLWLSLLGLHLVVSVLHMIFWGVVVYSVLESGMLGPASYGFANLISYILFYGGFLWIPLLWLIIVTSVLAVRAKGRLTSYSVVWKLILNTHLWVALVSTVLFGLFAGIVILSGLQ